MDEIYIHLVMYRRLATYQKFLIDRRESMCDYLAGGNRGSTLVLNIYLENYKHQNSLFMNHTCPYRANETLAIISPRFPMKLFEFPLLPSGDYRMHTIYGSDAGPNSAFYIEFVIYVSISDHRVWH